jgi:hypothetical protein
MYKNENLSRKLSKHEGNVGVRINLSPFFFTHFLHKTSKKQQYLKLQTLGKKLKNGLRVPSFSPRIRKLKASDFFYRFTQFLHKMKAKFTHRN